FGVVLLRAQQKDLGFGQDGGQRVRQIVPQLPDRVLPSVRHLEQRAVEIAKVVVAEIAHGLPQVGLGGGAKDLGGGALHLRVRSPEQESAPHDSILGAATL